MTGKRNFDIKNSRVGTRRCIGPVLLFVEILLQFTYPQQYAPFFTVERGKGPEQSSAKAFLLFWTTVTLDSHNKNTIKQQIEHEFIHILKVLGGLGPSFKKGPGVLPSSG